MNDIAAKIRSSTVASARPTSHETMNDTVAESAWSWVYQILHPRTQLLMEHFRAKIQAGCGLRTTGPGAGGAAEM